MIHLVVKAGVSDYNEFLWQNPLEFLVGWIKFGREEGVKHDFHTLARTFE